MNILQTSESAIGQIYLPAVNWYATRDRPDCSAWVWFFDQSRVGYGVAVTGTMLITTILTFFVIRYRWHFKPRAGAVRYRLLHRGRCGVLFFQPAQDP
jgi:KUP system potassium uptake protein